MGEKLKLKTNIRIVTHERCDLVGYITYHGMVMVDTRNRIVIHSGVMMYYILHSEITYIN